ncbi:MAG: hypothetical protein ACRCVU_04985 [Flavobacterium sp.]
MSNNGFEYYESLGYEDRVKLKGEYSSRIEDKEVYEEGFYKWLDSKIPTYKVTDCLCASCGTTLQDQSNGYCKNGHDDWYEGVNEVYRPTIDKVRELADSKGYKLTEIDGLLEDNNSWEGLN